MNQREFHDAVRVVAGRRYFSTSVEAHEFPGKRIDLTYVGYIDGRGREQGTTGESVVALLAKTLDEKRAETYGALGALPVTPAPDPADVTTDEVPW